MLLYFLEKQEYELMRLWLYAGQISEIIKNVEREGSRNNNNKLTLTILKNIYDFSKLSWKLFNAINSTKKVLRSIARQLAWII